MTNQNKGNVELEDLLNFISSKYKKEEIDWFLSLAKQSVVDNKSKVEIKVSSKSYANEK